MSFQAYLDAVETKTGKTPRQIVDEATARGHGMAIVHVVKNGPGISTKHVGTSGSHADPSETLWLDGKATDPARA